MPQFLEQRFGARIRTLMAIFWLAIYVFVNLTSITWLGSIAVNRVAGVDQDVALVALGGFALLYQFWGGLKAVALTDIVQVTLLVMGGLLVSGITLNELGGDAGIVGGFTTLVERLPGHFDMILSKESPHYMSLPGISVLVGGMWIANLSYWGFNQYIIQRALAAKSIAEAQKGVVFAAYLKLLMPVIVVLPGIAAVMLAPGLEKPDQAYPTMMRYLPTGILGLVFSALVAAIVASTASKINSVATIFTLDLYAKFKPAPGAPAQGGDIADPAVDEVGNPAQAARERELVRIGRISAVAATVIALLTARPLVGQSEQAFQFIQEFTGFFTPGITAMFLIGLFWKRGTESGALAAAVASVVLSWVGYQFVPGLPFLDRMGLVFLASLGLAVAVSLMTPQRAETNLIVTRDVSFATPPSFNFASLGVILILIALYTTWW
jgi:SSS family solute:Na+ symporter